MENFDQIKIATLETAINYNYQNLQLLEEALSHPSLKQQANYGLGHLNYEKLELLGDAVLGFIITDFLFREFPEYDEGEIARIKSHLVSKEILCKVAMKINLPEYIIMTKGEEISGGRNNPNNIENVMEAIIGSVYLDGQMQAAKKLVISLWQDQLNNINFNEIDPKTHLQEWCQANKYDIPSYEIIDKHGPVHIPIFTIRVVAGPYIETGTGGSIKIAEKEAAKKLLTLIQNNNNDNS